MEKLLSQPLVVSSQIASSIMASESNFFVIVQAFEFSGLIKVYDI